MLRQLLLPTALLKTGDAVARSGILRQALATRVRNWDKVSADEASKAASQGIPALVCWKNVTGIGDIAVVRPEKGEPNKPRIAQAGSKNFKNGLVTDGFGDRPVSYFIYKG
ncbi:MAG: hypothetical protein HWQ23_11610 [Nostoc sp. JL33]|uniref:hypothetical protein n=1 Tax=Nostoc sp. JL33 TaxID=2815396 RepID=UPI0025EE4C02|nr:hypothetical protein [Nostoc sp. JL33]MBN3870887.1 hypothetical protein [Nostoc sp. JL33]